MVCVSPRNHFLFTPLLASTAVGTLEFRAITEPVRRTDNTYFAASVENVDLARKEILCRMAMPVPSRETPVPKVTENASADDTVVAEPAKEIAGSGSPGSGRESETTFRLGYDKLIIAVGAISNTFSTPGVYEHARFLRDISDARAIRSRIMSCFEMASEPNVESAAVKRQLLHFVIVGAGPTGIQ